MAEKIDKRILLVEDNELIRALLKLMLTSVKTYRFEIWEASDGEEGLHMATQIFPDMAIVDIDMPVMNGIEMIREFRGHGDRRLKSMPLIVSTGSSAELRHEVRLAGANLTLEKPIRRHELIMAINILLAAK